MAVIRLKLDADTSSRLVEVAALERRPIPWQAEILLQQSLGIHAVRPCVEEIAPRSMVETPAPAQCEEERHVLA